MGIGLLTHSMLTVHHGLYKTCFIIDQQIARHFVHYSATQIIIPFLILGSQPIKIKGFDFIQS